MTGAEIAEAIGIDRHLTSQMMLKLIKASPKCPQRAHVCGWTYDQRGQRKYPRAVYAFGPGPNTRKPKPNPLAVKRDYEARKKSILKTSSVFNLAVSLKCLRYHATHGTKTENSAYSANTTEKDTESTEITETIS